MITLWEDKKVKKHRWWTDWWVWPLGVLILLACAAVSLGCWYVIIRMAKWIWEG
jgi:hypothetical protein